MACPTAPLTLNSPKRSPRRCPRRDNATSLNPNPCNTIHSNNRQSQSETPPNNTTCHTAKHKDSHRNSPESSSQAGGSSTKTPSTNTRKARSGPKQRNQLSLSDD